MDSTKGLTTEDVVKMNQEFIEAGSDWHKRQGYSSFWGLILMLFKLNRNIKKLGVRANYTITLPIKWI